jgi:aryl-alcohol dehydrogenase-like predicted oxidoreductase
MATTTLPRMPFGRTGHESSRVLFGAAALGRMSQERADQVRDVLDEFGVNHYDTAAGYGDSELRLAPWWRDGRRERVFLATKTGERTGAGARAELERSLERLAVDHVDLIQLHNLVEEDEWRLAHAPGGAVEALMRARDEGLTRAVGVTGHGLRIAGMHLRTLERADFDSVLLPYNFSLLQHRGYRATVEELLATCAERQVAVQTIKSVARRRWRAVDESPRYSWYEPLRDPATVGRAVRWVLGQGAFAGQLFVNSSSDATLLRTILSAAADDVSVPPTFSELAADAEAAKVEPLFDGAALERI